MTVPATLAFYPARILEELRELAAEAAEIEAAEIAEPTGIKAAVILTAISEPP